MDPFARSRDIPPQPPSVSFAPPSSAPDVSRSPSDPQPEPDRSDPSIAFMKGPKRKRLTKACDACHKSKRRCDGTAPCSNCYYASKKCTYTDATGKPVPAPRPFNPDRAESSSDARSGPHPPPVDYVASGSPSFVTLLSDVAVSTPSSDDDRTSNPRTKRIRTSLGSMTTPSGSPPRPLPPLLAQNDRIIERDLALTRELVHLFFAYRQPQRMIIHQPSFLAALSRGTVPQYLLLAVCAVAAPLSKQPRLRTSPCRYAGEMFAKEALTLMFDKNQQLVCEHNLATAQALLLLQLYDRMGRSLWIGQYHQLAMDIVTKLGIFDSDSTVLTPHPSFELIDASIERECARRVFWLIFISDCFGWMLFRRPRLATESQMNLRLPIDESSFEMSPLTAIPEFMSKPTPPYRKCSESGQMIRLLLLHEEAERFLDELMENDSGKYLATQLQELEMKIGAWAEALPEHMRFSDDNLWVHVTQYDTASNMGAWCFFIMHVVYCSCMYALNLGRQRCRSEAAHDLVWAQQRIIKIIDVLGRKAGLSILLPVAIWPLFKYADEAPSQMTAWSNDCEEVWGVRIQDLSQAQMGYRQQLRLQFAPPPLPMPPLPTPRVHGPEVVVSVGSISPVSRTGSDVSPSLAVQYIPQGRLPHDALFQTLSTSSYQEVRVPVGQDVREKEVRSTMHDANIDPALQGVPNARLQAATQIPAPSALSSLPSLPSLKSSGLLEWPRPGSADAIAVPTGGNWPSPTQHLPPTRVRSLNAQSTPDGPRPAAPSVPSGMPVGLQWLAHESSWSRPS